MEIRILHSLEDAEKYRSIRLESLHSSPESFASSYEEEKDFSIEQFKNQFQSEDSFTYGAFDKGNWLESSIFIENIYLN